MSLLLSIRGLFFTVPHNLANSSVFFNSNIPSRLFVHAITELHSSSSNKPKRNSQRYIDFLVPERELLLFLRAKEITIEKY